jgi:S-adenosyl-L-methionine hydrolase (adenosine-forming)
MALITLSTDFGTDDFYVGVLKAALLKKVPLSQIIDLSHVLIPGDLRKPSMFVQQCYRHFPDQTIHLMALTPQEGAYALVCFEFGNQIFMGLDTGQYFMGLKGRVTEAWDISHLPGGEGSFPALKLFPSLVKALHAGKGPETWGVSKVRLVERHDFQPSAGRGRILGNITYIDRTGNAITNIHKDLFDQIFPNGTGFRIQFRMSAYTVRHISQRYSEVPSGNLVAVFNESGYLELAIHLGSFHNMLGIFEGDTVNIESEEQM